MIEKPNLSPTGWAGEGVYLIGCQVKKKEAQIRLRVIEDLTFRRQHYTRENYIWDNNLICEPLEKGH